MRAIIYICCAMLLALPFTRSEAVGNCPSVDPEEVVQLADDKDCTAFYKCLSGEPVIQYCPEGLVYNPEFSVCDYPENVSCPSYL